MDEDMKKINGIKRARVMNWIMLSATPINIVAWLLKGSIREQIRVAVQAANTGNHIFYTQEVTYAAYGISEEARQLFIRYSFIMGFLGVTVLCMFIAGVVGIILNSFVEKKTPGRNLGIVGSGFSVASIVTSFIPGVGVMTTFIAIPLLLRSNHWLKIKLDETIKNQEVVN